jgi:hypothetical protein
MAYGGDMGEQATLALLEILGKTVQHLESTSDPHDPDVQRLKHSLLLAIAELDLIKENKPAA